MKIKMILVILIIFSTFVFGADALGSYDDSYLDAYNNTNNNSVSSSEFKKYSILLLLALINVFVAFMPLWILTYSAIKNVSNAPMNEHFQRIIQGEPLSYFINTFAILIVAYFTWKMFLSFFEITLLKSYAPLIGPNAFTKEMWTLEVPETISGRYGNITILVIQFITIIADIAELIAALTSMLLFFASAYFTYTNYSSLQVNTNGLAVVTASFVVFIVFISVSTLYDLFASPILNNDSTALSMGRVFLQIGVNKVTEGDFF